MYCKFPRLAIVRKIALSILGFFVLAGPLFSQDRGIADFPKLNADTDWPWWRGPMRNGMTVNQKVPSKFGDKEGVRWEAKIPGRSHASPTVVGDRLYLSTADEKSQVLSIVALDRASGKIVWNTEVSEGGFPNKNHPKNTAATPTIVSDGERIYGCFFHHKGIHLVSLDFKGKILTQRELGAFDPKMFEYGYAPTPCLYKGTLIVCAEYDGKSFLVAVDRSSLQDVWRVDRPTSISFSSPVVANVAGRDQLLMSGNLKVSSYDPSNGKPLWEVDGTTNATCGTMIWEGDTVFASGGYPKAETIAVKADGSGKVLWRNGQKCYEQSMIVSKGYVYALTDKGVVYCWRASDGKEMWNERLKGPVSASPVLVADRIYWANELGTMYVFAANPEKFEMISENKVGEESFASPAVCGNQLFLRVARGSGASRQEYLLCFGE